MMRLVQYVETNKSFGCKLFRAWGGKLLALKYLRICNKYNCFLPHTTIIGPGVSFPHNLPIVINPAARIGNNCIIHPNVLIGTDRGKTGAPEIGNNCFLGDGCKIVGNCRIGDWCFIAPNAVITKDIPSGSVVGSGVNKVLSEKGKEHMVLYLSKKQL